MDDKTIYNKLIIIDKKKIMRIFGKEIFMPGDLWWGDFCAGDLLEGIFVGRILTGGFSHATVRPYPGERGSASVDLYFPRYIREMHMETTSNDDTGAPRSEHGDNTKGKEGEEGQQE